MSNKIWSVVKFRTKVNGKGSWIRHMREKTKASIHARGRRTHVWHAFRIRQHVIWLVTTWFPAFLHMNWNFNLIQHFKIFSRSIMPALTFFLCICMSSCFVSFANGNSLPNFQCEHYIQQLNNIKTNKIALNHLDPNVFIK